MTAIPDVRGLHVQPDPRPDILADCVEAYRGWLDLPDPGHVYITLATVAANRAAGDPVWTLLVGPPGSGKTEVVGSVVGLPECHPAATLTEAALLSGTPQKEVKGKGGLLREIGGYGIIVLKDFTSVLSMHRDARSSVLAALREIYDGAWTRHLGTDGGKTLHWEGKVGLIAGCTPAIDSHHAVMASMGERFCIYRLPPVNGPAQIRRAMEHIGHEPAMRADLAAASRQVIESADLEPRGFDAADLARLTPLAELAARCRSSVERDSYSREIELIPESEAPARIALTLRRLFDALVGIGVTVPTAWALIAKVGLDSMPAVRRAVLTQVVDARGPITTKDAAEALGYPTTTARRALEDLAAHGVVEREGGSGSADLWRTSAWTEDRWSASVPKKSGDPW